MCYKSIIIIASAVNVVGLENWTMAEIKKKWSDVKREIKKWVVVAHRNSVA